jgi:hypothetical protein
MLATGMATLGVAFRRALPGSAPDRLISTLTWGPYVHTELWLDRGDGSRPRTYASFRGVSGFTPSVVFSDPGAWSVARYPLPPGGYERVYALLLQLLALNLPYNERDLWQCCIQVALPFEKDLDCERPETWGASGGVFCSQAALLVLRRLGRAGILRLPPEQAALVEATHSRGCSPNALHRLLSRHEKKTWMKACWPAPSAPLPPRIRQA